MKIVLGNYAVVPFYLCAAKDLESRTLPNRPFSYSMKEPRSSVIVIQFYTRGSIE